MTLFNFDDTISQIEKKKVCGQKKSRQGLTYNRSRRDLVEYLVFNFQSQTAFLRIQPQLAYAELRFSIQKREYLIFFDLCTLRRFYLHDFTIC
jgi:hypothetical protein